MNLNPKNIITKYPSLCYTCEYARRPADDTLVKQDYVGCVQYLHQQNNHNFISKSEILVEGWVDLRSCIFSNSSGITTNNQLLTCKVSKCQLYKNK